MMMLIILHDGAGRIVAMGESDPNAQKGTGVGIVPAAGQYVVEVEKSGELHFMQLKDIIHQYAVDAGTKRLVKR
jgi:hypothetical protein